MNQPYELNREFVIGQAWTRVKPFSPDPEPRSCDLAFSTWRHLPFGSSTHQPSVAASNTRSKPMILDAG
ncbi:MAG: hypothetical protein M9913_17195 [Bryobacteraceae bacterium]|nr:hypothetical protein [Bryobacteraceae bacterium]